MLMFYADFKGQS